MPPHVAILIPAVGQRDLANLARDAIAKFTANVSHEVWLLDHPRRPPWPEAGSDGNAMALLRMLDGLGDHVTHVFAMHDDALPIQQSWLSALLAKPGPVRACKISQRSGYAHPSGVLWDVEFALARRQELWPDMPRRDTAEFPASWCAEWHCHRPREAPRCPEWPPPWWWSFDCDVSVWTPVWWRSAFYLHLGGGSIGAGRETEAQRVTRVARWIVAARNALGL